MIKISAKVLLISCFLFFYKVEKISSQTFSKKINWQNKRFVSDSITGYYVLDFEKAAMFSDNKLPYFAENINIRKFYDQNFDYKVKLENPEYIVFKNDELSGVLGLENIKESIIIESEVHLARGVPYLQYKLIPAKRNKTTGKIEKLTGFKIKIIKTPRKKSGKQKLYAENSVLQSGTWVKIRISKTGLYKLTFEELQNMGVANPENVRVFGNDAGWLPMIAGEERPDDLIENDILFSSNSIIFFAYGPDKYNYNENKGIFEPRHHYYSKYAYYFLTSEYNSGYDNSVKTINSTTQAETHSVNTYDAFAVHDNDVLNIAQTGRIWYGESFDINNNQNFDFSFPNLINSNTAHININVASTSLSSYFTVSVNGESQNITFSGNYDNHITAFRSSKSFDFNTGTSDNISVNLNFNSSSPAVRSWLDNIYINAKCNLRFTSGQMLFRNAETLGETNITKYTLSNAGSSVIIWDITDPVKPKRVNSNITGTNQTFIFSSSELKEFTAFDNTSFLKPDLENVEQVSNQNLHATPGSTDMIIVTNPDFTAQANELKNLHETMDNMNIKVVTQQQVYNEFSCGADDFSAIRDYARMVYHKASSQDTLRYLLLFGDGSYDNRTGIGENGNYMITYQRKYSEGLTVKGVSDDFFGMLDDDEGDFEDSLDGMLDIGVGRIPVSTVQQASEHIAKIKNYMSPSTYGDWRNQLCFIADDLGENDSVHMTQTEDIIDTISKYYPGLCFNIEKIYLDAYTQYTESGGERYPDANNAINNRVQKGALLLNYIGHGGEHGLAHERVVSISEIESWKNFDKLPIFVTATCEFTRFDDYEFTSAGERVFLNPDGGAIALFTTARVAYIGSNGQLTKEFYRNAFKSFDTGERYRLGDIIRITKTNVNSDNNLIFFLMGDPALKLGYAADNNVVTTLINDHSISEIDTLKALSEASFSGEVQDKYGNKLTNFNGFVYPTVFDKERLVTTQNNDGEGAFTYLTRNNTVYKGKASVTNGNFRFNFIVPRDIALNVDSGKVSYYADNGVIDAKGYSFDFLVGDIADDYPEDNTGPEINLYMNDENFVSGGMTDKNPRIFAKLYDEHGINTASGGIGHDITGIIDDDVQNIIVMNDDYRADEDTYKSGKLEHFLFNLDPGEHKLKFKAFDVYNNSSEEYLEFVVIESENLSIDRLLNYPNPFTTHTDFYFEHNQAGTEIDVLIQIFTISGKLVKTIESTVLAGGYRAGPYAWNGTDDFGNRIGRGVYVYRVKLRSSTGEIAEKFEKLLILK
ncbi:MAG: type IX secretion system sortase PorU [Bacteroidales bacterium]|nr:type IX secretion system sortase PorU [Bacteroidales bacterium]